MKNFEEKKPFQSKAHMCANIIIWGRHTCHTKQMKYPWVFSASVICITWEKMVGSSTLKISHNYLVFYHSEKPGPWSINNRKGENVLLCSCSINGGSAAVPQGLADHIAASHNLSFESGISHICLCSLNHHTIHDTGLFDFVKTVLISTFELTIQSSVLQFNRWSNTFKNFTFNLLFMALLCLYA